ncbi:MAG: penicillin-binding transpeptidase domain-containing protein, partial [Eubacteriales bacterium]|nr:penicillin-binding transpeptidase domain-containing protein [Eubacteriales bacterium]
FRIMELRFLILQNNWNFQIREPILLADNVPDTLTSLLNEQNYRFPGITVGQRFLRRYTSDSDIVSHALGYVGQISSEEYAALRDEGYSVNDVVGKTGIEQAAERYLRGIPGAYTIETWQGPGAGYPVSYPGSMGKAPQAGNEVRLTLDTNLQRVARDNLERKLRELRGFERGSRVMSAPAGSVIAMDAKTGAVLVNANYPDYRVSDFVDQYTDPLAAARVQQLLTDTKNLPLLNRGISRPYAPGSTFKPVTAMAAFENGTITAADTIYRCNGHEEIGGLTWYCLQEPYQGHGELNLQYGLMTSCNLYFYLLGVDVGIDAISDTAKRLGLGESTELDIANENLGVRPSRAVKQALNTDPGDQLWFVADTAQTSIGQFYNSYTMLQMARAIGGIATNHLVTPHFIKEVVAEDGTMLVPEQIERIPLHLDEAGRSIINQGMTGLTTMEQGRTADLFRDFPYKVAAKTGTAEVVGSDGDIYTNAVFVCYAPADDPEIVVASILEDASYGDQSADIAYRILCEYFGHTPTHDYMGLYDDESARLTEGYSNF